MFPLFFGFLREACRSWLREDKKLSHIGKNTRKLYENIDFCRTNGTIENELLCLETDLKE